jgi:hypothetical protein
MFNCHLRQWPNQASNWPVLTGVRWELNCSRLECMEFSGVCSRHDTVFRAMSSPTLYIVSFTEVATVRGGLLIFFSHFQMIVMLLITRGERERERYFKFALPT